MKKSKIARELRWTLLYILLAPLVAMGYSLIIKFMFAEGYIDPSPTIIMIVIPVAVLILTAPIIAIMVKFDNDD